MRYVFADVYFDKPTSDDATLKKAINALGDKFPCIDAYVADTLRKNALGVRAAAA